MYEGIHGVGDSLENWKIFIEDHPSSLTRLWLVLVQHF